ncbi:MAG: glycosyltransferase [Pseudomonadota bacterium]
MKSQPASLKIAMLSVHSSPVGDLGTRDTGGMSVYIRELAKALGKRGHHIDIFTRHDYGDHEPVIALYDNVRIIHLNGGTGGGADKSALYSHLPKFFHDLESFRIKEKITYDVIHSHYWLSGVLGADAQSSWNVPHMLTFHTIGAVKKHLCPAENESDLRLSSEKMLAGLCDQIIVPTQKDKNYLIAFYDVPPHKIRVIPCGVDMERFKPVGKSIARQQLAMRREDRIVLCVGRHTPIKGLDRLLKAVGRLKNYPRLRLILVGGDGEASPMFRQLQSEAKTLNIQDHLTFTGRVDQERLPLYYSAADVLAVPSYYESFGLVGLEALACGTPVVTTPVGDMENIVKDGLTGYVAVDPDPRSFAAYIEAALVTQQANGLSPEQIRASVSEFTWEAAASKMIEAYRSVVYR